MAARPRPQSDDESPDETTARTRIGAYESSPGRLVFVEDGNSDGWIATDLAVIPYL